MTAFIERGDLFVQPRLSAPVVHQQAIVGDARYHGLLLGLHFKGALSSATASNRLPRSDARNHRGQRSIEPLELQDIDDAGAEAHD
jgi:hypothetical protein